MGEGALQVSEVSPAILFSNRQVVFLQTTLGLIELVESEMALENANLIRHEKLSFLITSNFIIEPILPYVNALLKECTLDVSLKCESNIDIVDGLCNTSSSLSENIRGYNFIFIRISSIFSYENTSLDKTEKFKFFIDALNRNAENFENPLQIFICPESFDVEMIELIKEIKEVKGVALVNEDYILNDFHGEKLHDNESNIIASIPYAEEFYAHLAFHVLKRVPFLFKKLYKVVVVDCDNTIWNGSIVEDGLKNIKLNGEYKSFQSFLKELAENGVILAAVTKNNKDDVESVFKSSLDMPLHMDDFFTIAANWDKKSENILKIAMDLNISTDDFLFIDDNILECNEVQNAFPDLTVLNFPSGKESILGFLEYLKHFFDLNQSSMGLERLQFYKENLERKNLLDFNGSPLDYIKSLRLVLSVTSLSLEDNESILRFSEMTYRTNQFNFTQEKLSKEDVITFLKNGGIVFLLDMKDRFGKYGIVGAVFFTEYFDMLKILGFLVSCRALMRGVEHTLLSKIAQHAISKKKDKLVISFKESQKNEPALNFVKSLSYFVKGKSLCGDGVVEYELDSFFISQLKYEPLSKVENHKKAEISSPVSKIGFSKNDYIRAMNSFESSHHFYNSFKGKKAQEKHFNINHDNSRDSLEEEIKLLLKSHLNLEFIPAREDSFFSLGGSSLLAVRFLSVLHKEYNLKLSLVDFLRLPTIENILKSVQENEEGMKEDNYLSSSDVQVGDRKFLPATNNEYWMWLNNKISGFSWHYNLPYSYKIKGKLNIQALQDALEKTIQINPILRTIFFDNNGMVCSKTFDQFKPSIEVRYVNKNKDNIYEFINEIYRFEFNFSVLPLFKVTLVQDEFENILVFNFHHIIFDAISYVVFKRELGRFYRENIKGEHTPLVIKDYIKNTNYMNRNNEYSRQFWQSYLADIIPLALPLDKQRPAEVDYKGKFLSFTISQDMLSKLTSITKKLEISLFSFFYSSINILLSVFCNTENTQLCISTSGREKVENDDAIQFFSNVLMLKMKLKNNEAVEDYLKRGYLNLLEVYEHQDLPFYKVLDTIKIERIGNHHPLCQILLTFLEEKYISPPDLVGIKSDYYRYGYNAARMDLVFEVIQCKESLNIGLYYNNSIFYQSTISTLLEMYVRILEKISSGLHYSIDSLFEDKFKKMQGFQPNNTRELTFDNIFLLLENSFSKNLSKVAIQHGNEKISYHDIQNKIIRFEEAIRAKKIPLVEEGYVVIDLPRGIDLIVSILTVLKMGFTFVALDQKNSHSFKNSIIDDIRPLFIITDDKNERRQDYLLVHIKELDSFQENESNKEFEFQVKPKVAYLVFTSGSSGRPKGVIVTHKNIINLVQWSLTQYSEEEFSSTLFSSSIAFDLSMFEIFCALASGGKIVIVRDVLELIDNQSIDDITLLNTVPTSAQLLLQNNAIPKTVKVINLAGEVLSSSLVKSLYALPSVEKIYNLYAPAETTTYSTFKLLERQWEDNPTIGKPIFNTSICVLNADGKELGVGEIGELCIAGYGVTSGYLNNTELTQEKFIQNNHAEEYSVYYKTGDLARYLMNGDLELLGRMDHEVKISGYRINLNLVESVLMESSLVDLAAVIVISDIADSLRKHLYAFVIPKGNKLSEENFSKALKNYFGRKLPYYMIPSYIKLMDTLPTLVSGKIDKNKLLETAKDFFGVNEPNENTKDSSELEDVVYRAWENVLSHKRFDRNTNFFDAGGNSILIVELYNKLKLYIAGFSCRLVDLFVYPTIMSFLKYLKSQTAIGEINQNKIVENYSELSDIAIIGYACRFPKSENFEQYWDNIKKGIDCISKLSREELEENGVDVQRLKRSDYVPFNGVIKNIYDFDSDFFDISPAEAALLDPQHRVFLELCWEALEIAGCIPAKFDGQIGVFAGNGLNQYGRELSKIYSNFDNEIAEMQFNLSQEKDYLSTRVAYKLGLTGAALNINTGCSTSLVAIVKACQSLVLQETDVVLAGGVSLVLPENSGYFFTENHVFSKTGVCRAFDKSSDGTVPSSGAGVVVLKRLNDAIRDHDNIFGVIKGYALNNDGNKKVSFTAPSSIQQKKCIQNTYKQAKINARDVSYIEAHGTGTQLGDPIELSALNEVYDKNELSQLEQCAIGGVKSNIGHTDAAAGVAGLLKITAMLYHKEIPPQINFTELNNKAVLNDGFYINSSLKPWDIGIRKRIAAVSSFGLGGTNAHMVVEEYQGNDDISNLYDSLDINLIVLSAKTKESLIEGKKNLLVFLKNLDREKLPPGFLTRIAYTLQLGRADFKHRYACFCKSIDELIVELQHNEKSSIFTSYLNELNNGMGKKTKQAYLQWIAGGDVNWNNLYGTQKIKKIILPTYPFKRSMYKLSFSEKSKSLGEAEIDHNLPTKLLIKNIWSNLLGVQEIDNGSDFFALGGQSITMLRLLVSVDKHCGIRISYDQAFKNKRFGDFLSLIEKVTGGKIKSEKIELLKSGCFPAIILIHPGNGELFAYNEISTSTNISNAIYGISNPLLNLDLNREKSIEHLSLDYKELIESINLETFILVGWSFGGTIAYELAQYFSKKSSLRGVILIDSWACYPDEFNNDEHFQEIIKLHDETNNSSNYLEKMLEGLRNRMQLLREYKPKNSDFSLVLLKAREKNLKLDDETNFFGKYTSKIHTIYVEGNHDSLLSKKYSATFLKAFCSATKHLNNR